MAKPFTVSIPHRLGQEEATRRVQSGVEDLRARFSSLVSVAEEKWTGSRMDFRILVLGRSATGALEVNPDTLDLMLELPVLLSILVRRAEPVLRKEGQLMLEKK